MCDLARSNPRNSFLPRNKAQGGYNRCVRAQIPPSPKSATPRSPGPFAKRPPLSPPPLSVLPVRAQVADTYPLEYRRMRLVHPLPGGGPVSKAHGAEATWFITATSWVSYPLLFFFPGWEGQKNPCPLFRAEIQVSNSNGMTHAIGDRHPMRSYAAIENFSIKDYYDAKLSIEVSRYSNCEVKL